MRIAHLGRLKIIEVLSMSWLVMYDANLKFNKYLHMQTLLILVQVQVRHIKYVIPYFYSILISVNGIPS